MPTTEDGAKDSPVMWIAVFEGAIRKRDFGLANEANDQLRRLGVEVSARQVIRILSDMEARKACRRLKSQR